MLSQNICIQKRHRPQKFLPACQYRKKCSLSNTVVLIAGQPCRTRSKHFMCVWIILSANRFSPNLITVHINCKSRRLFCAFMIAEAGTAAVTESLNLEIMNTKRSITEGYDSRCALDSQLAAFSYHHISGEENEALESFHCNHP